MGNRTMSTYRKAPVTGNEAVGQLVDHEQTKRPAIHTEIVDEQARGRLPAVGRITNTTSSGKLQ